MRGDHTLREFRQLLEEMILAFDFVEQSGSRHDLSPADAGKALWLGAGSTI
jgi:hypothetical protein